ncbi:MAG: TIGR02270 family protein, partial [Methylococcales bacterium]
MITKTNPVIPHIIDQHAEEAAFLWLLRDRAVSAPHYNLKDLAKLDNRVEAHIDGLRIAGDHGWEATQNNLTAKEPGEVFVAGVLALEDTKIERLNVLYQTVEQAPETVRGFISAFGWVEPQNLCGKVNGLLVSAKPLWRRVGIAACAIHRTDPGIFLDQCLNDDNPQLRARAARAAGELGRTDLKPVLLDQVNQQNSGAGFWSAWSAVRLGDRGKGLDALRNRIIAGNDFSVQALQMACRVLDLATVKELLKVLVANENRIGEAIVGAAASGDPVYMPWLIKQMESPKLARVAGEAFSFISGVDIAYEDLEGELRSQETAGPTEDPADEDVDMDPAEDLPVPDPILMERWWTQQQHNFQPHVRYLSGRPV